MSSLINSGEKGRGMWFYNSPKRKSKFYMQDTFRVIRKINIDPLSKIGLEAKNSFPRFYKKQDGKL